MSKIVFFIDTKAPVSGSQAILLDLAAYIADNSDNEVYYVNNHHDDDVSRHTNTRLNFGTIDSFDFSDSNNAIYFTPVNYALHLLANIKDYPNARICHYIYDAKAISWLISHIGDWSCDKIIRQLLSDSYSCAYLNYGCVINQDKFNRYDEEIFMPYCLAHEYKKIQTVSNVAEDKVINIAFYNTFGITGANVLQNLFYNIAFTGNELPVNIHIIGDVRSIPALDFKMCSTNSTKIIFTGDMTVDDSMEYIRKNVDFILTYGDKAVESSVFGVPVVIPVTGDNRFAGNNFVYLFDVNAYTYTWTNQSLLSLNNTCYKIDKILKDIYVDGKKGSLAKKCMEYCFNNNALEKVSENFYKLVENSKLTVRDYLQVEQIENIMNAYSEYKEIEPKNQFVDFIRDRKK